MAKGTTPGREQIIRRMWKLANAGVEDAVKLACFPTEEAPVYSVIALSRQAFCSYTFFIFSQRKDGENVAECYKTIEYPDRKAIAALYAAGAKAGQIAKEIGVAPRTIYAELKRGREGDKLDKNFRPSYDADLAQKRAQESLRRRGRRKGGPAE